jgi:hypothetical protein
VHRTRAARCIPCAASAAWAQPRRCRTRTRTRTET